MRAQNGTPPPEGGEEPEAPARRIQACRTGPRCCLLSASTPSPIRPRPMPRAHPETSPDTCPRHSCSGFTHRTGPPSPSYHACENDLPLLHPFALRTHRRFSPQSLARASRRCHYSGGLPLLYQGLAAPSLRGCHTTMTGPGGSRLRLHGHAQPASGFRMWDIITLKGFRCSEFPEPVTYPPHPSLPYRLPPLAGRHWHCALTGTHRITPWGGMPLFHYTLELYRDPQRLPSVVPTAPDFSLRPCRVTTTSPAHVPGLRCTVARTPQRGFSPLPYSQGSIGFTPLFSSAIPLRPVSTSPKLHSVCSEISAASGLGRGANSSAPIVTAPARLRARGFSNVPGLAARVLIVNTGGAWPRP